MINKTFQQNKRKKKKDHEIKERIKTKSERSVLKRRRTKGRKQLCA